MSVKKDIKKIMQCIGVLHERITNLENNKPFKVNVDNVTMEHIDNLIQLKKEQIKIYKEELLECPQSQLSSSSLRERIDRGYNQLERLYVIKSLKEKGESNGSSEL